VTALPDIYWQTYIAVPVARVYRTLATAAGWDGWFTRGATLDDARLVMRWTDAVATRHRTTLWGATHATAEAVCPIVAAEPDRRFCFSWTPAGHPTTVDFRLAPRGDGTVVTVAETGYTSEDLGATGVTGGIGRHSPYAMCASGWAEALTCSSSTSSTA
jgi:uncharacterized protein YndB with AHSA1/START domain